MNLRQLRSIACVVLGCVAAVQQARSDDSAASIAAGGLVARREARIVMAKEVLKISPSKVVVDYDFRNDTNEDVITEVAFPVPPYGDGPDEFPAQLSSFAGFHLSVDGKRVQYETEAKAFLKGKEVTPILKADKIDIPSFGHYDWDKDRAPEFSRLPKPEQGRLVKLGLFDSEQPWGNWTVRLQYHWRQTFPAHSTVHIRHEYSPVVGFTQVSLSAVEDALNRRSSVETKDSLKTLQSMCADHAVLVALQSKLRASWAAAVGDEKIEAGTSYPHWVDFILTSANTWRQPIEDFTLVVDRGTPSSKDQSTVVSFCSPADAPVQKIAADEFEVHLTNFIPKTELRIGFFDVQDVPARKSSSQK